MKSKNVKYWIWLSKAIGFANKKIKALYELYNDISVFCLGGEKEWKLSGILTINDIERMKNIKTDAADFIIDRCDKLGYSIIAIDDDAYPKCLKAISNPPAVLYVWGNLPDVDNIRTVGIVGTRTVSNYGLKNSFSFGYALSRYDITVISGGALGVDCASHKGALAANGVTVCVLGCGINYPYLMDNASMRESITLKGAVISEYPPDTPPMNYQFPARNRIIAALSDGVLIIESGKTSGSLITADYRRIKSGSAKPVTDFMDIIIAFSEQTDSQPDALEGIPLDEVEKIPVKSKVRKTKPNQSAKKLEEGYSAEDILDKDAPITLSKPKPVHREVSGLSQDAEKIYRYLTSAPVNVDKISQDTDLPVYRTLSALTELEICDLAVSMSGNRFALK